MTPKATIHQSGVEPSFISVTCGGEFCFCGRPAVRKVGEEIPLDDPNPIRHNLTAYVCAEHFGMVLGPLAARSVGVRALQPNDQPEVGEREKMRAAIAGAVLPGKMRRDNPLLWSVKDVVDAAVLDVIAEVAILALLKREETR